MGIQPGPSYEYIYLAQRIDEQIRKLNKKTATLVVSRHEKLHPLNNTTPQGEAASDRCECNYQDSFQFLETSPSTENGKLDVDLYEKDTLEINIY